MSIYHDLLAYGFVIPVNAMMGSFLLGEHCFPRGYFNITQKYYLSGGLGVAVGIVLVGKKVIYPYWKSKRNVKPDPSMV